MRSASATPKPAKIAISTEARARPAASASEAVAPAAVSSTVVELKTVASDFNVPETARSMVMRPAKGSAIVFHTNAA